MLTEKWNVKIKIKYFHHLMMTEEINLESGLSPLWYFKTARSLKLPGALPPGPLQAE